MIVYDLVASDWLHAGLAFYFFWGTFVVSFKSEQKFQNFELVWHFLFLKKFRFDL